MRRLRRALLQQLSRVVLRHNMGDEVFENDLLECHAHGFVYPVAGERVAADVGFDDMSVLKLDAEEGLLTAS